MSHSDDDPRPEILLDVDYGYSWPLSTIFWDPKHVPDWERELPAQLNEDLRAWAKFFNDHANYETGMFGGEKLRKHFQGDVSGPTGTACVTPIIDVMSP